jgi:hypothetical protein
MISPTTGETIGTASIDIQLLDIVTASKQTEVGMLEYQEYDVGRGWTDVTCKSAILAIL